MALPLHIYVSLKILTYQHAVESDMVCSLAPLVYLLDSLFRSKGYLNRQFEICADKT